MEHLQEILEAVSGPLSDVANGEAVVGSPIQLGSVTVYPISRVSIGLGGGGGQGENPEGKGAGRHGRPESGAGGGSGGAAKARPVAVLVFSGEGVTVLPIPDRKGKLDGILEKIPELIERFKPRRSPEA
jgi:uncharacterized spore protein YtfJ